MDTTRTTPETQVSETRRRDWLAGAARGDEAALAALYDDTAPLVYSSASRVLRDRHAVEEAALDVYLQIWREAERFDPSRGSATAWIVMLARTRAIDRLRASRRDVVLPRGGVAHTRVGQPERASVLAERRSRLLEALGALKPQEREVIEWAFFDELSHSEVAERLGLPLGTVKTRIRLGLRKLRRFLRPLTADGSPSWAALVNA